MSRLEELIQELCPDGVEFKAVSDVCDISRGRVMSKDYLKENAGEYPVYSSQTANDGIFGEIKTYDYDGEYLTWTTDGANAGSVFYRNGRFSITNVCGLLSAKNEKIILTRFLWYALSVEAPKNVSAGMGNPKLMSNAMAKIEVPVPPLGVQREIVRILDEYTEKNEALKAELAAELAARKKQYEYYRDELLSFGKNPVEWSTIGEVFDVKNGYTPSKKVPENWENGDVPWFRTEDIRTNGRVLHDSIQHVHSSGIKKAGLFKKDSIIISTTATLGEHAIIKTDFMCNQQLTCLTIKEDYKDIVLAEYAFFYCFIIDNLCDSVANHGGGIPIVDQKQFKKLPFPIPSIQLQKSITDYLTRFDKLSNDISEGLPAEIDARQKQYEHYRDKLLTFKEKEA